jgi:hypothetical protein
VEHWLWQLQAEVGQYISSTQSSTATLTGLTGGASSYSIAVRSQAQDGRLSLPYDPVAPVRMLL